MSPLAGGTSLAEFSLFSDLFTLTGSTGMLSNPDIWPRWRGEVPILVIALALFALCTGLLVSKDIYPSLAPIIINIRLFAMFAIALLAFDAGRELVTRKPDSPLAHLKARYLGEKSRTVLLAGAPMLAICIVLLPFFSKMKAAIPLFNEYTWDNAFIAWDRALFFGYDAWEILQPVLGYPYITALLALLYQLWFLLLYVGIFFFAFGSINPDLRRQFFLSYILSWTVIGGAMATWLASVGPCFVGPMLGDPRFDAQMAYLYNANETVPVMVLPVQEMLLEWYNKDSSGLGSGITAMPSMHVAIAFLFYLAMRQISPRAGMFFGAFFATIWISSIHLAYHYAVDGLVSVIALLAIWWIAGLIIRLWDNWLSSSAQPALGANSVPAE